MAHSNLAKTLSTKAVPPAALVPEAILAATTDGARSEISFHAGRAVFRQGEPADALFFVRAGKIQITVLSDQGKEAFIAQYRPGDFFGEGCLAGQPLRTASATATVASKLVRIEKVGMRRLLADNPELSEQFTAFLMTRNIQVEADLIDQLFNSSEKRLARLLLLLSNFNNDGRLHPIVPKVSQELLAERVGTTRSRINFFMNKFRRLGLIEYNRTIQVLPALINVIAHDQLQQFK